MNKSMKKIILLVAVFATVMLCLAFPAGAEVSGDYEYEVLGDGTVEITGYTGNADKIVIPSEIDSKKVTVIGEGSFRYNESITGVTIPDTVTDIGYDAFYGCKLLTDVKIPDSVLCIDSRAFDGCYRLETLAIPSGVTVIGEDICNVAGNMSFDITTVILCEKGSYAEQWAIEAEHPYVVTDGTDAECIVSGEVGIYKWSIDKRTGEMKLEGSGKMPDFTALPPWYDYAAYVTSLSLPDGMTRIGEDSFRDFNRLKSVVIPDSVTEMEFCAFWSCDSLADVTLSKNLTTIGAYLFSDCYSIKSITLPDSLTVIGDRMFMGCSSLEEVHFGKNIKKIDSFAFDGCTSLSSVNIPDGVKTISWQAFLGCERLSEVTLSKTVKSIGSMVFSEGYGL